MAQTNPTNRRGSPRKKRSGTIEFEITNNIVKASSVNYSETGICFNSAPPLKIETATGQASGENATAQLIWAKRQPDGSFAYGFEYVKPGTVKTDK